jgi:methionyl-tRNA formyltransferase
MMPQNRAPFRIIFFGTAELACASLKALLDDPQFRVVAVVTQPDKPKGRDLKLAPSFVKQLAQGRGVPLLQPKRARDEAFISSIKELAPDLMVVVAYGQILPQALLDIPAYRALNVHTSLLPRHRGAAPIQWAILDGDKETGVTIMKMDAGLDTGPILTQAVTAITASDNAQTLHDRLAEMGAQLLVETIPAWMTGAITPRTQPEGATYARKITKEDGHIQWSEPAEVIWNKIRGFTPWPGAFTYLPTADKPRFLKIWSAHPVSADLGPAGEVIRADKDQLVIRCGQGALAIDLLQKEGGKRLGVREFLMGNAVAVGTKLDQASSPD